MMQNTCTPARPLAASLSVRRARQSSFGAWWTAVLCVVALGAGLFNPPAQAGLTGNLTVERYNDGYIFWPDLSTNTIAPAAPLGYYIIHSPQQPTNGAHREYELTASGLALRGGGSWYYSDFDAAMNGITNGNWTITVTNATATNVYAFQIANHGLGTNLLPRITITYPTEGLANVPSQPTFTWQGTAPLPGQISAYAYQRDQNWNWTWYEGTWLNSSETSWTVPTSIPPGQTYFYMTHHTNHSTALLVASTPQHTNTAQPLSGWAATSAAMLYAEVGFTVTGGGSPLGDAVNAPHLTWTTGGDESWFAQTAVTHDGVSAAQSGAIDDDGMTYLETQVTGPGTLSFWWKVSSEWDADYLELQVDGFAVNSITGEVDWENVSLELGPGPHTLRWVYTKDFCCTSGDDAGWVDQVQFGIPSEVEVTFDLAFVREHDTTYGERFLVFPAFSSFAPSATTYHSAESPNNRFSAQWEGEYGSSSTWMNSLESAIQECTNGVWKLYVNKGDPSEQLYTFRVAIAGLDASTLGPVRVLSPVDGSVGVPTNAPVYWSGPADLENIFVGNHRPGVGWVSSTNLTSPATNWPAPPAFPAGTNEVYVQYTRWNAPYATFTTPVDASFQPVASWVATLSLRSSDWSRFHVGLSGGSLSNPQLTSTGLQFGFQTLAGRNHAIEASTNLAAGAWLPVTNFPGDGSLKQFVFPTTEAPHRFFRARTE